MSGQSTFETTPMLDQGRPTVTLVEGSTFCIADPTGDVRPGGSQGLFVRDTRILSRWELRVDGAPLQPLQVVHDAPFAATFVCRATPPPGRADATVLVQRRRLVGEGMREELSLENLSEATASCTVTLLVDTDFADLFEVKEHQVAARSIEASSQLDDGLRYEYRWLEQARGVRISADPPPAYRPGRLTFQVKLPPRGRWEACVQVQATVNDTLVPSRHAPGEQTGASGPRQKLSAWRAQGPVFSGGRPGLVATLRQSQEDLGVLRIFDAANPDRVAVAAGAPWFMSLFGRDSLISAWMALPLDPRLALGTLQTLAHFQGRTSDPATEEQPGRIMHEMRSGLQPALMLGGAQVYYGTVDATPLFVMLLDEVRRWGAPTQDVKALLPAAHRALTWLIHDGDADGDGFVEYRRATDRGLANQGWKDSWDGINFASGELAEAPIALCEAQGYTYAAFRAGARLATAFGDPDSAAHWTERAEKLKRAFNDAFWLPDKGYYAIGLDAAKRPIDALASNMGHCLWTGIVDQDKAAGVAAHLLSPAMFSGWGIRTLASTMGAYNPMSYHNGSVWPHDNAIAVAGLVRYGFVAEAQRVALALMDAAEAYAGRLPELFCGFDRARFANPVSYPTSCSPQAWAAATPVHLLRTLLRLEPAAPDRQVRVSPVLPESLLPLRIERLRVGEHVLTLDVDAHGNCDLQAPAGVTVRLDGVPAPRHAPVH